MIKDKEKDNLKKPDSLLFTKEFVEEIKEKNNVFKTVIELIDSDYLLLYNKKYDEERYLKEVDNVYFMDPGLIREFREASKSGKSVHLDEILVIYSDWVIRLDTMLRYNARHYHKNKRIRDSLDELALTILPNAKAITKKVDTFVIKAEEFFDKSGRDEVDVF